MDKKLSIDLFSNLYSMVIADGIIDPKEMELLNQIGHNVYKFTDEEIIKGTYYFKLSSSRKEYWK